MRTIDSLARLNTYTKQQHQQQSLTSKTASSGTDDTDDIATEQLRLPRTVLKLFLILADATNADLIMENRMKETKECLGVPLLPAMKLCALA